MLGVLRQPASRLHPPKTGCGRRCGDQTASTTTGEWRTLRAQETTFAERRLAGANSSRSPRRNLARVIDPAVALMLELFDGYSAQPSGEGPEATNLNIRPEVHRPYGSVEQLGP